MFPYRPYRNFFLCILFLCLFCQCTKHSKYLGEKNRKQDSIAQWIEKGRSENLKKEERSTILHNAFVGINSIPSDSSKMNLISRLSLSYLMLGDSVMFRKANLQAINLAKEIRDSLALGNSHWDLAYYFQSKTVMDSAFYHYFEANKIYEELNNQIYSARILYNMGVIQNEVKDYTGAEINIIRAIEKLKPFQKNERLYNSYNLLGTVSIGLKEYDNALEYYNQALDYFNRTELPSETKKILENNIGNIYLEQKDWNAAIQKYRTVLKDPDIEKNMPLLYAKALNNLGYAYLKSGSEQELPQLFNEAKAIQDSINDLSGLSRTEYSLAEYYGIKQDTIQALSHAIASRNLAKQSKNNERLLMSLDLLSQLDTKDGLQYANRYIALNDSLQQEERKTRDKFARIRFETNEFVQQNELLEDQRKLWISIAAILLLLGTTILLVIFQQIRNQRLKFEQKEQENNEKIFNLMLDQKAKIKEGKHEEQKRISEELHDGVLGQMLGIRLMLFSLNKKEGDDAREQRLNLLSKLQGIEEEIRGISHELNHAAYEKLHNFVASINDLLESICDPNELEYGFDFDREVDWDRLTGDIKINSYRIIQECLHNCVKHAQATKVHLDFHTAGDYFDFHITDNGKGFVSKNSKRGIGLKNMESRVSKMGGSYKVESEPGKGTRVSVIVPLKGCLKNEKMVEEEALRA